MRSNAGWVIRIVTIGCRLLSLLYEAIHLAAIDVARSSELVMRRVEAALPRIVKWPDAFAGVGIRNANRKVPRAVARYAISSWECPEVAVERAVFLHHDHDVLDLVDALRARGGRRCGRTGR